MKIKIAFTVWVMIIMITNSSYAQPGKTMSIDDNAASKNKANTSTNQNQILKKGYGYGFTAGQNVGPNKENILWISNLVEVDANGGVSVTTAWKFYRMEVDPGHFYYHAGTDIQDFETATRYRNATIQKYQKEGYKIIYINDFSVKKVSSQTNKSQPEYKQIQLSTSSGTTTTKGKEEDFWNTPENKTTKQEAKKQEELKRKEQQQEASRQLENAKQNPYVLNGVSNRDTVYEDNMQLIQSLNPDLNDAIVTISWTNTKTNQSTTLTGINNKVTLNEGWNKFNIAVWVKNTPLKSTVALYYSKNSKGNNNAIGKAFTETAGGLNIEMVPVEGSTFSMGSNQSDDEKPVHRVTLSSYYIGKYEVTQAQWKAVMGRNPSHVRTCTNCPVDNVTWDDVHKFIAELNKLTGRNYRLPTEAEWEFAARGGINSKGYNYSGSDDIGSVAWIGRYGEHTHSVGLKQPNELGLHDMTGNVSEWCSDRYDASYYSISPDSNPQGPSSGSYRVIRGCGSQSYANECRIAIRKGNYPDGLGDSLGFRLALSSN